MLGYPDSLAHSDRERVYGFLATFSRWECALKHKGFAKVDKYGQVEADWKAFAIAHDAALSSLDAPELKAAREALMQDPPKREELVEQRIEWRPNPRRQNETSEAVYLFRVIRDVRNNLFHGGKFAGGPEVELARDRHLIENALAVLEGAADLHAGIKAMLDESAY